MPIGNAHRPDFQSDQIGSDRIWSGAVGVLRTVSFSDGPTGLLTTGMAIECWRQHMTSVYHLTCAFDSSLTVITD